MRYFKISIQYNYVLKQQQNNELKQLRSKQASKRKHCLFIKTKQKNFEILLQIYFNDISLTHRILIK